MADDLIAARELVLSGTRTAGDLLDACLAAAASPEARFAFTQLRPDDARVAACGVDAVRACGLPLPPLAGLAVSVKDLFDVQGQVTTAGSKVLRDAEPAAADAAAVARLRRAGAAFVGRSNMTEFAFSGVGINPHYGTPANATTARLGDGTPRVPGGSTSGGAVSVASGAAFAALGSDTAGSIRIPAALHGLVGFKNTASLTPTAGALPLSPTLDTVCAISRSVRDAVLLHEVLAERSVALEGRTLRATRLAIARTVMLDGLDPAVAQAFEAAIDALARAGASIEDLALTELAELGQMQAKGSFSAAEAWAWHRELLARREADYDHRVVQRMRVGETMSAADYIDLHHKRRDWMARMHTALRGFDAVLSPTAPILAPPLAELEADDAAFFRTNALLLRNTIVVNLLDGCAITLPCQTPGTAPVGLMLWAPGHRDDRLLDTALAVEAALLARTKATT
jgi:amidase/aspartyl-tRNA(Asn)/glutamyl-tRNA(Gln) amidotransferase subunit A